MMMKKAWLLWSFASLLLGAYITAGFISAYSPSIQIKLEPGVSVELTLLRLTEHSLRMSLIFKGDHRQRSELGDYAHNADWFRTSRLQFAQPGSSIRMTAATLNALPVYYEAMPNGGWGTNTIVRNMTSNLSIEPGVWLWPPPPNTPQVVLNPGFTTIKIQIVSVEPPLVGEIIQLAFRAPLGFKECMPNVCWLWGWVLWPAMMVIQAIWAVVIVAFAWRKSRRNERREVTS
jgi:hypothetical protein